MFVPLSPEQEAQLARIASERGRRDAGELAQEVIAIYLQHEKDFADGVEQGLASLDRGEFLTDPQVQERVDRLFQS